MHTTYITTLYLLVKIVFRNEELFNNYLLFVSNIREKSNFNIQNHLFLFEKKSMKNKTEVLILGGGLSGLSLAYFLSNAGIRSTIFEGRDRLGGRIHTLQRDGEATVEMGATWFSEKHMTMVALLEALDLMKFPQKSDSRVIFEPEGSGGYQMVDVPQDDMPSFRVAGGTSEVINTLTKKAHSTHIELNQMVESVSIDDSGVKVSANQEDYHADYLVSTIPLHLFHDRIQINPALPTAFMKLLENTHTWMEDAIKFGLTYDAPFWREKLETSTIFSHKGPIVEMYEHNNKEDNLFAIKGFLHPGLARYNYSQRRDAVIHQLTQFYGDLPKDYLAYEEKIWGLDPMTYSQRKEPVIPHQNNGDHRLRQPLFDGKFFFGGSETSVQFPGYMDGAVHRAKEVSEEIIEKKQVELNK